MESKQDVDISREEPDVTQDDERLEDVSGGAGTLPVCPSCGSTRYLYSYSVGGLACRDCYYTEY